MGFIEKTFDLKKFVRALRKQPDAPERNNNPEALTPAELKPCLRDVYIHVLRYNSINIRDLNFDTIGEGDIDDLEEVLNDSPATELFAISDVFKRFEPSAATKRVFI